MDAKNKYRIAFEGLSAGTHRYEFEVRDDFFAAFENSEVKGGRAGVTVDLAKSGSTLKLDFVIEGEAVVECDRCLADCSIPVHYEGTLAVRFTSEQMDDADRYDGEVLWLEHGVGEIDLAQYIYESIVLSLPYQRVHAEDAPEGEGCDPEMLGRFSIVTGEEFDKMTETPDQKLSEAPGWEKLQELKEKLEDQQ